jgi:hypothetical protein
VIVSRSLIVGSVALFLLLIRQGWKRNGYDDRAGFREVEFGAPAAASRRTAGAGPGGAR